MCIQNHRGFEEFATLELREGGGSEHAWGPPLRVKAVIRAATRLGGSFAPKSAGTLAHGFV